MNLLKTAFRLAAFRRVPEEQLAVSWMRILVIVAATLLPPLAFALVSIGSEGHFAWRYLPGVFFHVPVILVGAVVIAYLIGRRDQVAPILVATLLAWVVIDFVSLGAWLATKAEFEDNYIVRAAFHYVPLVWLALAITRFASTLLQPPAIRSVLAFVAASLLISLPLGAVYRERSLWTMDYSRKAEDKGRTNAFMAVASEDTFYRQPELLQRALAELKPGRKGVIDVYMIGVAGDGHQDVFMREVESVATLFRERFDAEGRIVKLVNNSKTVLSLPVASTTSLKASLKRVGEVMDPGEDVLVLFLTSHGSQDHHFSLELWPLGLKQMDPAMLREMLDASGIKNRVVIVSACYAGGFVRALSSDNTLVIAAAAPDKNSFGCNNENEWTYFGKAYFDEALRKTVSFTQAFEMAKPVIEEREKKEKFDPSQPQMSVGSAIKTKLDALERQLTTSAPAETPDAGKPLAPTDKAERYVALLFQPEMSREYYEVCKRNLEHNGPDKTLERSPAAVGGLNHSSPQWPRLVAAWQEYSEKTCAGMNNPAVYRAAYLGEVRESMTEKDLDLGLRLMSSNEGREWFEKEKAMAIKLGKRLNDAQTAIDAPLYDVYVKERDRLFAEAAKKK